MTQTLRIEKRPGDNPWVPVADADEWLAKCGQIPQTLRTGTFGQPNWSSVTRILSGDEIVEALVSGHILTADDNQDSPTLIRLARAEKAPVHMVRCSCGAMIPRGTLCPDCED